MTIPDDDKAAEVEKFTSVLEMNGNALLGDALYALNRSRQTRLRRPQQMPKEDGVAKLRGYTTDAMSKMTGDKYLLWTKTSFAQLRDLACSRLTVFNARRGGEPARMTVAEWKDAESGAWLDSVAMSNVSTPEKQLKCTYMGGKGNNHMVSVLIPEDTVAALLVLSDLEVRALCGVNGMNKYLFPGMNGSLDHVSGWQWHALHRVCAAAGVSCDSNITATTMRHRASTLFAGLNVPESNRQVFYKHMGHSADINCNVYQTPQALNAIVKVGASLQQMDIAGQSYYSELTCLFR